ncbi:hypothetical protein ACF1BB_06620 [Streptomyces griseoluteus]|uniref:hypothetical protein n=1 Tax=Streptomyces griseoluteus TaxID=29306 RepID=UPI0036F6E2C5
MTDQRTRRLGPLPGGAGSAGGQVAAGKAEVGPVGGQVAVGDGESAGGQAAGSACGHESAGGSACAEASAGGRAE